MHGWYGTAKGAAIAAIIAFSASAGADEWRMVWSDEFNGASIDTTKWTHEVNGQGGGNDELQYYTARPQNSFLQDGKLVLKAIKETYSGPDGTRGYTSARLNTRYKGDWLYGRIEARAKVPGRQGLWPAIWMLPTDFEYGGWAASGEIDIMEHRGDQPSTLHTTIHHGGPWPNNTHTGSTHDGPDLTQDFHEFAIEWEQNEIRWYLDGNQVYSVNNWYSTGGPFPAPFNKRFHLLMNVAVGGNFLPNPPDNADYFPRQMEVDWVRVYEKVAAPAAQTPFGPEPQKIPGTIIAAEFDHGGQDVAYHDTTPTNIPAATRLTEAVDLEPSSEPGGGYAVAHFEAGEWLEYTVQVETAGTYSVKARVASATDGGALTVKLTNDANHVESVYGSFEETGGWGDWETVTLGNVYLTEGLHTLRVVCEDPQFNLSQLEFLPPTQGTWGTEPIPIPGKVSMQDYDTGGEGIAYHDTTPGNVAGSFRADEDVDLGPSFDTDGANSIGWFDVGEWVEYTVEVQQNATYSIEARTASESESGTLRVTFTDSGSNTQSITNSVPPTGGWVTWGTFPLGSVSLTEGVYVMRLELLGGVTNVNFLQATATGPAASVEGWMLVAD